MRENPDLYLMDTTLERLRYSKQRSQEECVTSTILPAYTLMNYNETSGNTVSVQSDNIEYKKKRLKDVELAYQLKSDLIPTIGVELELPKESVSEEQQEVISGCGISVKPDWGDSMTEIAPDFSYSALAQSRVLQECAHLGVNQKNISEEKVTHSSFHINFGIPNDIDVIDNKDLEKEARVLVDAITYGFVSPARILSRKTLESMNIKSAPSGSSLFRLEVRTPDFSSPATFRLLEESQLLAGACFAYAQDLGESDITVDQVKLSVIWSKFKLAVSELVKEYGLSSDSERPIYNTDPKALQKNLLEHPEIKERFRLLVTETSKEIKEVVQLGV